MKKKSFLFYNKKGAMGKTTHAIIATDYFQGNFYTNDVGNDTLKIYSSFLQDNSREFKELAPKEEILIDDEKCNIFDFGGFLDNRIIGVAKFVDYCIVPICYQSIADLTPSLTSIANLSEYNKNIVILINNTDKKFVQPIFDALRKKFEYPIFVVNQSEYIRRLANANVTIFDLHQAKGSNKRQLEKPMRQMIELYSYLEK